VVQGTSGLLHTMQARASGISWICKLGLCSILEAVMNSISNGLGMRNTGTSRKPNRPWNPHFYAIFTQVHNTL
jgi:hypothetical protein